MKKEKISNNVIRRLPRYLRKLDELTASGVSRISSTELGQLLGFTPSQIRQDFNCFGEFGQQGYGYNVPVLREQIAGILGMDRGYKAVLIGVGHIGRALIDNFCFSEWGIDLIQAFDVEENLIGKEFSGVHVSSMEDLTAYLKRNKVDIVVLAVPREAALPTAKMLIENDVHATGNFTNVELVEPDSPVIVENVHFSDSLLALSYFVSDAYDTKKLKK